MLRHFADFNECKSDDFMDCDQNAQCRNVDGTFFCNCGPGYTDTSVVYNLLRGRKCEGKGTTTTSQLNIETFTISLEWSLLWRKYLTTFDYDSHYNDNYYDNSINNNNYRPSDREQPSRAGYQRSRKYSSKTATSVANLTAYSATFDYGSNAHHAASTVSDAATLSTDKVRAK